VGEEVDGEIPYGLHLPPTTDRCQFCDSGDVLIRPRGPKLAITLGTDIWDYVHKTAGP
jgi:hypothetical protein